VSGAFRLGEERRCTLLFYHRQRVEAAALAPGQPLVVGREHDADVVITDPGLSREHARFELTGDEAWVEDLGSTNGTRVNGQAIDRARLRPGDVVHLGSVAVSLHQLHPAQGAVRGLLDHERFLELLEQELTRHRLFGRRLGILLLQTERGGLPLASWWAEIEAKLRPVDRPGLYGPSAVEVLVPEISAESLDELGHALIKTAAGLRCATALFPDAGTSAAEICEVLRATLAQTSVEHPVVGAPATLSVRPKRRENLVVESPAMKRLYATVERLSRSTIPVLILGETGTGKEVIAHALHQGRGKRGLPCINCAAIPPTLLESTMFGHEKGAFTGADRQAKGVFEEADGGSVFLDEIAELSPAAQAALLRVLDTQRITRVGSTKEIPVNVRIIAATHRDLEAMCEAGAFRRDLLFRINTMTLKIPPIRERAEEIRPLAELFLAEARQAGDSAALGFEAEALALLESHSWPGNVRELRNAVLRAAVLAQGSLIAASDLPERVLPRPRAAAAARGQPAAGPPRPATDEDVPEDASADAGDYKHRVQRFEIRLITRALEETGWNKTRAAEQLRIPLRTLIYKMQSFGLVKQE
jgi:DNA-binding NtrC family response regulator